MKIILYMLFLCMGGLSAMGEGYFFRLKGNVIYCDATGVELLDGQGKVWLSAPCREGQFVLKGTLPEPGEYILKIGERKVNLLLDGKDMELFANYEQLASDFLYGSPAKQAEHRLHMLLMTRYQRVVDSIVGNFRIDPELGEEKKFDLLAEKVLGMENVRKELITNFIREYAGSIYAPVAIGQYMNENHVWGSRLYELLTPEIRESLPGRLLGEKLKHLASTAIGVPFVEFDALDRDGRTVKVGGKKGKVCVIDFWASWCGPCRAEMQYLKQLYKELEGKDVCFYSISLDQKKDAWLQADQEEQLQWSSLWLEKAFKAPVCKSLCIEAIPFIIVIDKEGKIAGKGLRGKALAEKVEQLLNP